MEDLAKYPQENPNPVLRISADGMLMYANNASEQLLNHWDINEGEQAPEIVLKQTVAVLQSGQTEDFDIEIGSPIFSLLAAPQPEQGYVNIYGKDITEMRQTQRALTESEERYRAFIENTSEGIWRFEFTEPISIDNDPETVLQHSLEHAYLAECNDAMAAMYGFTDREDLLGIPLGKLLPEDNPEHKKYLLDFIRNGFQLTNRRTHEQDMQGNDHVFENSLTGIIEDEQLVRVWGTQQDVTQQEADREALRLSEEKFRALTETTASAIFIYQGKELIYANKSFREITGYSEEDLRGIRFWDVVHEDHRELIKNRGLARQQREDVVQRYEFKIIRKDGQSRWVDFTATRIEYEGAPAGLGTAFDITERKRGELLQSAIFRISEITHTVETMEEVYPEIHEIIQELMPARNFYIALYDEDKDMIRFPYFVDEHSGTGASRARKSGKGITEYVLHRDEPLLATHDDLQELVNRDKIEAYGEYSVDWLGVPLRTQQQVIGVLAVQSYDEGVRYSEREKTIMNFISRQIAMTIARKRAESDLARERQQLAVTLRSIADGVITTDTDGRIRLMNKMAEQLTGWPEEEARGKQLREVFPLINRTTKEPSNFR